MVQEVDEYFQLGSVVRATNLEWLGITNLFKKLLYRYEDLRTETTKITTDYATQRTAEITTQRVLHNMCCNCFALQIILQKKYYKKNYK